MTLNIPGIMELQAASDSGVGRWEKVRLCSQTVLTFPWGTNMIEGLSIFQSPSAAGGAWVFLTYKSIPLVD